ncbi:hypothetical protein PTKIN_Ptkin18bG0048600 [Pterospermum kingtungense]
MWKALNLTEEEEENIQTKNNIEDDPSDQTKHWLDFNGALRPDEYVFKTTPLWIRVNDLPLGMRNRVTGERIGARLGKLIMMDESLTDGRWVDFLRLRVEMDITRPLRRAVKLTGAKEGTEVWGRITYERLPTFCYCCGLVGHAESECESAISNTESTAIIHQYGDWMRASPLKKGIFFNWRNNTKARTLTFATQLKANLAGKDEPMASVPTTSNILIQKFQMSTHQPTSISTTSEDERGNPTNPHNADNPQGKIGLFVDLQQKLGVLQAGDATSEPLYENGKSNCRETKGKESG